MANPCCDLWEEGSKTFDDSFVVFGYARGMLWPKKFVFKFCPWCGKVLESEKSTIAADVRGDNPQLQGD